MNELLEELEGIDIGLTEEELQAGAEFMANAPEDHDRRAQAYIR